MSNQTTKTTQQTKDETWDGAADLARRMFAVDLDLPLDSRNWNHNLAFALKTYSRVRDTRPAKWAKMKAHFDKHNDWIERGHKPLADIAAVDPALAGSLSVFLKELLA